MGILDEAIREHLELKRAHGAEDTELKDLEQDAFGPGPPGEPAAEERSSEASEALLEPGSDELDDQRAREPEGDGDGLDEALEAEVAEPPAWDKSERPDEQSEEAEARAAEREQQRREEASHPSTQEAKLPTDADSDEYQPPDPPTPPPDGSQEHALPVTGPSPMEAAVEAADEEEPEVQPVAAAPEAPPAEEPPPPDPVSDSLDVITEGESPLADFYDFDEEGGDLADELDQALEEDEVEEPALPPEPEPLEDAHAEPPVEAPVEEALPAEEPPPPAEEESEESLPPAEPAPEEPPPAAEPPSEGGEGDVLEETPEFLRDAPESDELWFEQRPPRDFDFDD